MQFGGYLTEGNCCKFPQGKRIQGNLTGFKEGAIFSVVYRVQSVRVKGGLSLRNGMRHGLRNDIIMWNEQFASLDFWITD